METPVYSIVMSYVELNIVCTVHLSGFELAMLMRFVQFKVQDPNLFVREYLYYIDKSLYFP